MLLWDPVCGWQCSKELLEGRDQPNLTCDITTGNLSGLDAFFLSSLTFTLCNVNQQWTRFTFYLMLTQYGLTYCPITIIPMQFLINISSTNFSQTKFLSTRKKNYSWFSENLRLNLLSYNRSNSTLHEGYILLTSLLESLQTI